MDTTSIYIKQCEKAVEVQELFPSEYNEYVFIWNRDYVLRCKKCNDFCTHDYCGFCGGKSKKVIDDGYLTCDSESKLISPSVWLPTQAQLQGMVGWTTHAKVANLYAFINRVAAHNDVNAGLCSMKQLWLAFVMSERYQKQWTGTDWEVK